MSVVKQVFSHVPLRCISIGITQVRNAIRRALDQDLTVKLEIRNQCSGGSQEMQTRMVDSAQLVASLEDRKTVAGIRVRTNPTQGPSLWEARLLSTVRAVPVTVEIDVSDL